MVQSVETEPFSDDGSTQASGVMAGLPPLLLGTYTPKIDAKGRMALPAKFRSQLGPGMVMARGQERCVYLLPQSEFRRIALQIQRHIHGETRLHVIICVCSFPARLIRSQTGKDVCSCRRCCAITRIWEATSW